MDLRWLRLKPWCYVIPGALALLALAVVVPIVLSGHKAPAPGTPTRADIVRADRTFPVIMAKAPYAYIGNCAVREHHGHWYEFYPGNNKYFEITTFGAPVPCYNLEAHIWSDIRTHQLVAQAQEYTAGRGFQPTNKLWIRMSPRQSDGSYVITWGSRTGVTVQWLLTFVNQSGAEFAHADPANYPGGYVWHPFNGARPFLSVYANDVHAPPGWPTAITSSDVEPMP